ncbi:MAG: CHAT domain-containing protein [Saprospiraceae bacterium]
MFLHCEMGNYQKAEPLILEGIEIEKSQLTKAAFHLSENELTQYTQKSTATTEESFKTLNKTSKKPSPNIIHIATHGYFFPDPSGQADSSSEVWESA